MRNKTVLVLIATLFVGGTAAVAWAKVVSKQKFKGSQVTASISAEASLSCPDGSTGTAFVNGSLTGAESVSKTSGSPKSSSNGVTIEVFSFFNPCDGVSMGFSEAGFANGFTPPNKKLDSAFLDGEGLLQDFDTGLQVPIDVDVAVTGTGPLSQSSSSTKTVVVQGPNGPVTITITRSSNSNRAGTATGTVAIDNVVFTINSPDALLLGNHNSEKVIEHK